MRTEIIISDEDSAGRNYLTWAPVRATVKLLDADSTDPVDVVVDNQDPSSGGQLEFAAARNQNFGATLNLTLPPDGSEVQFFVAGEFSRASSADGDVPLVCLFACHPQTVLRPSMEGRRASSP